MLKTLAAFGRASLAAKPNHRFDSKNAHNILTIYTSQNYLKIVLLGANRSVEPMLSHILLES